MSAVNKMILKPLDQLDSDSGSYYSCKDFVDISSLLMCKEIEIMVLMEPKKPNKVELIKALGGKCVEDKMVDTEGLNFIQMKLEVPEKNQEISLKTCPRCRLDFANKYGQSVSSDFTILLWNIRSMCKENEKNAEKAEQIRRMLIETQPDLAYINEFRYANEDLFKNLQDYEFMLDDDDRNASVLIYKKEYSDFIWKDSRRSNTQTLHFFRFEGSDKLAFTYVRPYNSDELADSVTRLVEEGFSVLGDLNLKANKRLMKSLRNLKIKPLDGDENRITVVSLKKQNIRFELLKRFPPMKRLTDHASLLVGTNVERLIKKPVYIYNRRLLNVKQRGWMSKYIDGVTERFEVPDNFKFKLLILMSNEIESKERLMSTVSLLFTKDLKKFWDRVNKLSAKAFDSRGRDIYNEELSHTVMEGFRNLYGHNENKIYGKELLVKLLKRTVELDWGTFYEWRRSKTNAVDFNGLNTKLIWKQFRILYEEKMQELGTWYMEDQNVMVNGKTVGEILFLYKLHLTSILKKLMVESLDLDLIDHVVRTFFLKKSKKITTYKDIRCIGIAPATQILFEEMIAHDCILEVKNLMRSEMGYLYQFAGVPGCSTVDAIYYMFEGNRKADDIDILIDLASAYESVNLSLLIHDLTEANLSLRVKLALLTTVTWYYYTDLDFGGNRVFRTKSLGMGNVLTPILFCFYFHKVLVKLDRGVFIKIAAYIDDLIVRIKASDLKQSLTTMNDLFSSRSLLLNLKKTEIITSPIVLNFHKRTIKEAGINIKKEISIRYLGTYLTVQGSKITYDQKKIYLYMMENRINLRSVPLKIKLMYFRAHGIGKLRYFMYTMILASDFNTNIFNKLRDKLAKSTGYFKFSYEDCIAFRLSPIRMVTNLVRRAMINNNRTIGEFRQVLCKRIWSIISQSKAILKNTLLDEFTLFEAFRMELDFYRNQGFSLESKVENEVCKELEDKIVVLVERTVMKEDSWFLGNKFYEHDVFYSMFRAGYLLEGNLDNVRIAMVNRIFAYSAHVLRDIREKLLAAELYEDQRVLFFRLEDLLQDYEGHDVAQVRDNLVYIMLRKNQIKLLWKISDNNYVVRSERKTLKNAKLLFLKLDYLLLQVYQKSIDGLDSNLIRRMNAFDVRSSFWRNRG